MGHRDEPWREPPAGGEHGGECSAPDHHGFGLPLPDSLRFEARAEIGILRLNRPHKRNALDDPTVEAIGAFFADVPAGIRCMVLAANGPHFCAGLDLSQLRETTTFEGVLHSRMWHRALHAVEFCSVPVVSVLTGAVIGGGLELAAATHIRVAEPSAFYALPEGSRGLFVGGGASVRVPRLVGAHRMADMMLTGRVLDAATGHQLGISHYAADDGQGPEVALGVATRIAANAPITNYAVIQALPRIQAMSPENGLFVESLMSAISQGSEDTKAKLHEFLEGRGPKVASTPGAGK